MIEETMSSNRSVLRMRNVSSSRVGIDAKTDRFKSMVECVADVS